MLMDLWVAIFVWEDKTYLLGYFSLLLSYCLELHEAECPASQGGVLSPIRLWKEASIKESTPRGGGLGITPKGLIYHRILWPYQACFGFAAITAHSASI
jgi:hypothetical protein